MPGSLRWPGWNAIGANMWNKRKDAAMFPPKVWGYGWSFNFAYPLITTKPRWKRVFAFLLGTLFVTVLVWALLSFVLVAFYTIESLVLPASPEVVAVLA